MKRFEITADIRGAPDAVLRAIAGVATILNVRVDGVPVDTATITPAPTQPAYPLEGIIFASELARIMATEAELTAADFTRIQPGVNGYKKADVEALIQNLRAEG